MVLWESETAAGAVVGPPLAVAVAVACAAVALGVGIIFLTSAVFSLRRCISPFLIVNYFCYIYYII